jgi:hypothetical protein
MNEIDPHSSIANPTLPATTGTPQEPRPIPPARRGITPQTVDEILRLSEFYSRRQICQRMQLSRAVVGRVLEQRRPSSS